MLKTNTVKDLISLIINKHLIITRYAIVLLAIIAITSLFPRNNFNYDFEQGKPWKYESLYAPFRFSIKKSPTALEREQKTALLALSPAYNYDKTVAQKAIHKFNGELRDVLKKMKQDTTIQVSLEDSIYYREFAVDLLDTIFERGIIELSKQHKAERNQRIRLFIKVNKATKRNLKSFLNGVPDACEYVKNYVKSQSTRVNDLTFLTPILCNSLSTNVLYDEKRTKELEKNLLKDIPLTEGVVQQGEVIIAQGAIVTNERYLVLSSLKEAYTYEKSISEKKNVLSKYAIDIGYFFITLVVIGIFILFLYFLEPQVFMNTRKLFFILGVILLFLYLVQVLVTLKQTSISKLNLHIIPFCIIPIIIKNFFGIRIATQVHLVILMLTGFIVPLGYEYVFLHLVVGLMALLLNTKTYYWSDFYVATGLTFLTYCIGYIGISLILENSFKNVTLTNLGWLVGNSFFTLLAYPLIPVFEKLFGFVSEITLVELSDLNKPILKKLSKKAPGTFWHTLQVASLAEAGASEVGANALLAKVGALYHDIGKMKKPAFFIENQKTEINPHDDLPPLESAQIIRNHVLDGIEMAKKEGLPNLIIDFIRTHHGNTRIEYFYRNYVKEHPNEKIDENLFKYPGPLPYSKETAILMMADSIEAASRSLKNPTEEYINDLVDNIIAGKIRMNQFVNCDISFKDLTKIKKVFKRHLRSIYHIRITYPPAPKPTTKKEA